jgi:hypothetical protein
MMENVVSLITRRTQMAIRMPSIARMATSKPRTISAKMGAYSLQETALSCGCSRASQALIVGSTREAVRASRKKPTTSEASGFWYPTRERNPSRSKNTVLRSITSLGMLR